MQLLMLGHTRQSQLRQNDREEDYAGVLEDKRLHEKMHSNYFFFLFLLRDKLVEAARSAGRNLPVNVNSGSLCGNDKSALLDDNITTAFSRVL